MWNLRSHGRPPKLAGISTETRAATWWTWKVLSLKIPWPGRDFVVQETVKGAFLLGSLLFHGSIQSVGTVKSEGSIDAETKMVLVNAVYFKGNWKTPFQKKLNRLYPFRVNLVRDNETDFLNVYFRASPATPSALRPRQEGAREPQPPPGSPAWECGVRDCTAQRHLPVL